MGRRREKWHRKINGKVSKGTMLKERGRNGKRVDWKREMDLNFGKVQERMKIGKEVREGYRRRNGQDWIETGGIKGREHCKLGEIGIGKENRKTKEKRQGKVV